MVAWDEIPGETPIDDVSGLIPQHITTRAQLNALEAENIRKAVLRYLAAKPTRRQAPFTLAWTFKLHKQMFGNVWRWAGTKRLTELNLGIPAHRIDVELQTLLDDLAFWRERAAMDLSEQATRLHHRAVYIHPFLNGNGRWGRLLANILLKQSGASITVWPDEAVGTASPIRNEYLDAIRRADQGDYQPLLQLHRKYTEES